MYQQNPPPMQCHRYRIVNSAGPKASQQNQHIREISGAGPIQIGLGAIPIAKHEQQVVKSNDRIVVEVPGTWWSTRHIATRCCLSAKHAPGLLAQGSFEDGT